MNLVIVESPAKGKTIKKILGSNFEVLASYGHVRDLPQKSLGVDVKADFSPTYEIPAKARKTIRILKAEIAKATEVYLATDYDREGEAIAWHIAQATGLKSKAHRITFHEITKPAVLEAIKHPREIDFHLVDAQQARRVLDRLVGYKLSPFLWQKVAQGLSAGRVQSVAVRLVVTREREIKGFVPREYWQIIANLSKKDQSGDFKAELAKIDGKKVDKFEINNAEAAEKVLRDLKNAQYVVSSVRQEEKRRYPSPPFTTSTMQQEGARRFSWSAKKTMKIAQDLYEDGLITYMRTDSVQVSLLALKQAKDVIAKEFGADYALPEPRFYKTKTRGAQEAHEAIRPTNLATKVISREGDHSKLYDLIWKKMLASQAKEAVLDEKNAEISAGKYSFLATGVKMKFPGFYKILGRSGEDQEGMLGQILPDLKEREEVLLKNLDKSQHFTEPPGRYTEGTLIKELEKKGIGRPSTYAPTLSTIVDRGYTMKDQGKFAPTEIGEIVTDLLVKHFPEIIDYDFTAKMEENLDGIAEGELAWQKVLSDFYGPFSQNLTEKTKEVSKKEITEEKTDEKCPDCGKNLVKKLGRYGKFLACSGFPECKYTRPLEEKLAKEVASELSNEKCPKCGKSMILKEGKFGRFLACSGYPECKTTKNIEATSEVPCPNCGGKLVLKKTRKGKSFWGCANYPKCKTAYWDEPQKEKCPNCGALVTLNSRTKMLKCNKCEYTSQSKS